MSGYAKYNALLPEFHASLSQEVEHVEAELLASDAHLYCISVILGYDARNPATDGVLDSNLTQPITAKRQALTAPGMHTLPSGSCVLI